MVLFKFRVPPYRMSYLERGGRPRSGAMRRKIIIKRNGASNMKIVAKTVESAEREARIKSHQRLYHEALNSVERLHRRLLGVIKDEFDRRGCTFR